MNTRTCSLLSFLGLCLSLAGCENRCAPPLAPAADAAASADGGAGDGAAPPADLMQAGPITFSRFGLIEARAFSSGIPVDRYGSTAMAQIYDLSLRGESCTRTVTNGCLLTGCSSALRPPPQNAGQIRLEGGQVGVTLSFSAGQYLTYSMDGVNNWPVGAPITISAPGAEVPGFSATVAMPARVVVTVPERPAAGVNLLLQRTADLTLTWEGGGQGALWFVVTVGAQVLECAYPASAGRGVVPAGALGMLPAASGTLTMFTADSREVTAGSHLLRTRAAHAAVARDGREWTAQLVLP